MITKEQQNVGVKLMNTLVEKCWENPSYKQALISNPKLEIEKITGNELKIPDGKKLVIEDQTNNNIIYINIPNKPDFSNIELSDEQLEAVSGGEIGLTGWIIISAAVLVAGGATGYAIGEAVKN